MGNRIKAVRTRQSSRIDAIANTQQLVRKQHQNRSDFVRLAYQAETLRREAHDLRQRSHELRDALSSIHDQFRKSRDLFETVQNHGASNGESKPLIRLLTQTRKLLPQDDALRQFNGSLLMAMEDERSHIARELHDDLNQSVASLQIDIASLQKNPPASADAVRAELQLLAGQLDELSVKISDISRQLHPSLLRDLGLEPAMRYLVSRFGKSQGIKTEFRARYIPRHLSNEVSISLYRILQEALHNVSKHARATRLSVKLSTTRKKLNLVIHDDGVGFDPSWARKKQGLGLISMEERARLIHGTFALTSRPGKGVQLEIRAPLPARHAGAEIE